MIKRYLKIYCLMALLAGFCTACSSDDEDTPAAPAPEATGTWTDERDGTEYGYVRYGQLEWTTSNLSYQPEEGQTRPDMTPVNPRYYDNGVATTYFSAFGLLYNHEAALAAVPDGWRLPTDQDWADLEQRTGGDLRGAIKLQLGGYFLNDDFFQQLHNEMYYTYVYGFYWTATIDEEKTEQNFAFYRKLTFNQPRAERESMDRTNYMNVRLVRDAR